MCTHAGRQACPQPYKINQSQVWFHFLFFSGCKQEKEAYDPLIGKNLTPRHTSPTQPRHADTVNPLVIPNILGEQQLLLFGMGSVFVVSFLLLCRYMGVVVL